MVDIRSILYFSVIPYFENIMCSLVHEQRIQSFFDTIVTVIVIDTLCYSFGNFLTKT